jgi:hypothetical protein
MKEEESGEQHLISSFSRRGLNFYDADVLLRFLFDHIEKGQD